MANGNIKKIRNELKNRIGTAHPICGHPLEKCDDYVKRLYIDILCAVAQYENKSADKIMVFVQRIMSGIGLDEPVSDRIKNAMEVDVKKYDEFMRQCTEHKLEIIFMTDSLIVACADGEPNRKQIELLTETAEVLKLTKVQVEAIANVVKAILMQDNDEYARVCADIKDDIKYDILVNASCYTKEFVSGVLVDCKELLWVYDNKETNFELLAIDSKSFVCNGKSRTEYSYDANSVIIEGLNTSLSRNEELYCSNCKKIQFKNCKFDYTYLYLSDCENISFEACDFHSSVNFHSTGSVEFESCSFYNNGTTQTKVKHTRFNKCTFNDIKTDEYKGIADNSNIFSIDSHRGTFELEACKFTDIKLSYIIHQGEDRWGSFVFVSVKNCIFENCFSASEHFAIKLTHNLENVDTNNNLVNESDLDIY